MNFNNFTTKSQETVQQAIAHLKLQGHRVALLAPENFNKMMVDYYFTFGNANEKPVFADKNLRIKRMNAIGKNKNVLKLLLENERGYLADAIMFQIAEDNSLNVGDEVSMLYYPYINEYNGNTSLQYRVIELKKIHNRRDIQ